jgi:hypothetical protein
MIMKTKRIELKESGVLFNEEEHSYLLDGKELSGITGMLQRQLFPDEFDGIPKHLIQGAADYGAGVHLSCEDFDKNWINDGTQEVIDYIQLCKDYGLVHECSEYTVTDGVNWASKIDKVYRVSEDTFSLGDIKTYGQMTPVKLEKARWQLSIYAFFFELMNRKAKIDKLFVIRLRNKMKKDGSFDHIKEIIFVNRIPSDICKELLDCDFRGERFINPFDIPDEYRSQEETIRNLIQTKAVIEEQLANIKAKILADMEAQGVKTWATETMRLIRKSPTTRSSFNFPAFKSDHPELEYESYMKVSPVAGSLQIVV